MQKHHDKWTESVNSMPKLKTYKELNCRFEAQSYLRENLTRLNMLVLAELRCGTFPLEIEKRRYRNIPAERRYCKVCRSGEVEDELHLDCSAYNEQRNELFRDIQQRHNVDFSHLNRNQILAKHRL